MQTEKRIRGLNTIRFLAFLWIFIGHATPYNYGYYEVYIFFSLSGFLLTYLALKEIEITKQFSRKNFFVRRALRIYPIYFLILIICFTFAPLLERLFNVSISLPEEKLLYFLFLSNYDNSDHVFALKFFWSIAVQEQLYLIFMVFAPFLKERIFWVAAILCTIHFMGVILADKFALNSYTLVTTYLPDFGFGIVAGYLYFNKQVPRLNALLLYLSLSLLSLLLFQSESSQKFIEIPISICITLSILITISLFKRYSYQNLIIKTTENLGTYTFGMYIFSGFVITLTLKTLSNLSLLKQVLFELSLLFLLSWLSYHFFEKRFINLKKYFSSNSPSMKNSVNAAQSST